MTDETGSPGNEAIAADLPADAPESFASASEAAVYFTSLVDKRNKLPAESADPATAENESALKEADAAPDADQAHGEDEDIDPASKEPPIERPKSWTESEEAEWRATPRALQQKIAARELERDTALRRTQNEAAEKLKGVTAKEQQVEQVTRALAAKLPEIDAAIQRFLVNNYSDIKTPADVTRMAAEDPFRKIQWDAHQQEIAAARMDAAEAKAKVDRDQQSNLTTYKNEQDKLFLEAAPELSDPKKKAEITEKVIADLTGDIGFTMAELNEYASDPVAARLLYSAGFQKLALNNRKLSEIKSAPAKPAPKDLPPVQRPGASRPSGQGVNSERIQALNRKPELTVKEATELYSLQQSSQRRAS